MKLNYPTGYLIVLMATKELSGIGKLQMDYWWPRIRKLTSTIVHGIDNNQQ